MTVISNVWGLVSDQSLILLIQGLRLNAPVGHFPAASGWGAVRWWRGTVVGGQQGDSGNTDNKGT